MAHPLAKIAAVALGGVALYIGGPAIMGNPKVKPIDPVTPKELSEEEAAKLDTVSLGAGCFWCVEAVIERFKGVKSVESGYMGGATENPTYKDICTGATGHAEVVQVKFDPAEISLEKLLEGFWKLHDPTTLNRQGADRGTQYRSAIFFHSDEQKPIAEASKKKADESGAFRNPIVTEITKASKFYPAEAYHQDYFEANKTAPYCRAVIWPKLEKLGLVEEVE